MLLKEQAPIERLDPQELPYDDELTPQLLMAVAMQAGVILLSSGAETYRVEDTIGKILSLSGSDQFDVNALGTSLTATLMLSEDGEPYTQVKRVRHRSLNLHRIAEINQLSRDLVAGRITLKQASKQMNNLNKPVYRVYQKNIAIVVMICSFALLLSGNPSDALGSIPVATGIILINTLVYFVRIEGFVANLLSAFLSAGIAVLSQRYILPRASVDVLIAAALMPLLPGTSFTNAIRDVIHGDYISAAARGLEAIFTAIAIAFGVGLSLALLR